MRWLPKQWRALTTPERWLFLGWPLGGGLFVGGLLGDTVGWWDRHAYLLEAVGSLTAFLIGIPVAVVVVGRLESTAAERAAERATVVSQAWGAHTAAQLLAARILDAYVATTWDRIGYQEVDGKKMLPQPLDGMTAAAVRMAEHSLRPYIGAARDALESKADVHETMVNLAAHIGDDVVGHDPDMIGWGEVLWKKHVPDLTGMGALTIASLTESKYHVWQRIAEEPTLPMSLKWLSWESDNRKEARDYLDKLERFYSDVGSVLGFLMVVLTFTEEQLRLK